MTFFTNLYSILWKVAAPIAAKNKRLVQGLEQRTLQTPLPKADLWIQAASVGESQLAVQLVAELNRICKSPLKILITTNTKQGYDLLNNKLTDSANGVLSTAVNYFPFDAPGTMKQAVSQVSPKAAILLETEIWPGFITALKDTNTPIAVINGRMRGSSLAAYLTVSKIFRPLAPQKVLAISEKDAGRYRTLFPNTEASVVSNIKFDSIAAGKTIQRQNNPLGEFIAPRKQFLVFGSIRKEEETLLCDMVTEIQRECPQAILGIFPRHMHRVAPLKEQLQSAGFSVQLRSDLGQENEEKKPLPDGSIVIWDTIGELMGAYTLAKVAFVGGSLAKLGGQNFLETAACGTVAVTGPSWSNFFWVGEEYFKTGCVVKKETSQEVTAELISLLKKAPAKTTIKKAFTEYINPRKGGTKTACAAIALMLKKG
ncbi:MAG: 3-deoxy-D-manno-octulosonic acid transferase [Desulfovibrio sp.]